MQAKFPKEWSENDVLKNIRKVAANDNLKWEKQKNGYYTATDSVDGIKMRVVLDGEKDDVVTGYPLNGSTNRCAKEAVKKSEVRKKQRSNTSTKKRTESTPKKVESTVDEGTTSSSVANASTRQPRPQNFNSR